MNDLEALRIALARMEEQEGRTAVGQLLIDVAQKTASREDLTRAHYWAETDLNGLFASNRLLKFGEQAALLLAAHLGRVLEVYNWPEAGNGTE